MLSKNPKDRIQFVRERETTSEQKAIFIPGICVYFLGRTDNFLSNCFSAENWVFNEINIFTKCVHFSQKTSCFCQRPFAWNFGFWLKIWWVPKPKFSVGWEKKWSPLVIPFYTKLIWGPILCGSEASCKDLRTLNYHWNLRRRPTAHRVRPLEAESFIALFFSCEASCLCWGM